MAPTSLHAASEWGNLDVVRELLGRGAKVGVVNAGGATSLMVASQGGHRDIVHALLLQGALAYA